jgi:MFS family permease
MGAVSGRLTDAGYYCVTTSIGVNLVVLGTFTTSISEDYWQILLAQGVCTGFGNGFLLTPMSTLVTTHFRRRLPLVMGIAACGSSTGGLIYPSMVRILLPTVGFGWTLRSIGFIQLGTFFIALMCSRPKSTFKNSGAILDWTFFKETAFTLLLIGSFLVSTNTLFGIIPLGKYS